MKSERILIVDDDPKVRALLRNCFELEGAIVIEAEDESTTFSALAKNEVDLITLDLHLGSDDGLEVARQIRKNSSVPIIMLTGKDDVIDRIVGLEVGADDYITKPFHVREVLARVRSVLRRYKPVSNQVLECGCTPPCSCGHYDQPKGKGFAFDGMVVHPELFEVTDRNGQLCEMTSGDFKLLNIFLERPKRVLSRENLMDLIDGPEWTPLDRTIDNQVARLRKKIERDPAHPKLIKTVRGIGYSFAVDVETIDDQGSEKTA